MQPGARSIEDLTVKMRSGPFCSLLCPSSGLQHARRKQQVQTERGGFQLALGCLPYQYCPVSCSAVTAERLSRRPSSSNGFVCMIGEFGSTKALLRVLFRLLFPRDESPGQPQVPSFDLRNSSASQVVIVFHNEAFSVLVRRGPQLTDETSS